jgi:hypothetical protein
VAQTANFKAEARSATPLLAPVLQVVWNGYGTKRYTSVGAGVLAYDSRVVEAGWGNVQPAISESSPQVGRLQTTVKLANTDRALDPILMGAYDQRRAAATIYRASPNLAEADWDARFVGIVDGWTCGPGDVTLNLSTDALKLEGFVPRVPILKAEFGAAPVSSLGRFMPLLFGEFASSGVGTGLLQAIPVNWVTGTTGWYLCCQGVAKAITSVWVGATLKTLTTHYTVDYAYSAGGRICTLIKFTAGNIPTDTDLVYFDAQGYTSDGTTSGNLITNPAEIIWTFLDQFVFSDQKTWTGFGFNKGNAPVDAATFTAVAALFDKYGIKGSRYLGGSTTQVRAEDALNEFLDSYQWPRMYWDSAGKLCLTELLPNHPGYPSASSIVWDGRQGVELAPLTFATDSTQIRRRTTTSFLDSPKDGRQMFSLDVQDLNVDEDVTVNVAAPWIASKAT